MWLKEKPWLLSKENATRDWSLLKKKDICSMKLQVSTMLSMTDNKIQSNDEAFG